MISLTGFKIRFTPTWRMSLLALLSISLFMCLGIWQIMRAHEKEHMLTDQNMLSNYTPILWQPGSSFPLQYQQIAIKGYFLPQILLLDNQHFRHQFGYNVLSPLVLSDNRVVLVDRGWVEGDITRRTFPQIHDEKLQKSIIKQRGSAYYPSVKNWRLGPIFEKKQANLAIVELIDTKLFSQILHKSVYPFIIRLNKEEPNGFEREWGVVAMSPQRHYGYALQWFVMGLVIIILYVALNCKKKYEN